jgi:hypothetical protein
VHRVSDLRQIEIHTTELFVPDPSPLEIEIVIAKLKRYISLGSDEILPELIEAGGETLRSEIHKLINSIWNKEELPDQRKVSIILPAIKQGNKTDCSNYRGMSLLSTAYKMLSNISLKVKSIYLLTYSWS